MQNWQPRPTAAPRDRRGGCARALDGSLSPGSGHGRRRPITGTESPGAGPSMTRFCARRYERATARAAIPADMPLQDWGITYARDGAVSRPVRKALWHHRARPATSMAASSRAATRSRPRAANEYPQPPLEITEAGVIFTQTAESLGYKPFPQPCRQLLARLYQPRRTASSASASIVATANASSARRRPRRRPQRCSTRCCCRARGSRSVRMPRCWTSTTTADAKRVTGVRYLDLHDGRRIRAAGRHRRAGGIHHDQHETAAA